MTGRWLLGACLAALLFWHGALAVPFHLDDEAAILHHAQVAGPFGPGELLAGLLSGGVFGGRPVTVLSFRIGRVLWEGDPVYEHLVSILLHAGVSVLLWSLFLRAGAALWGDRKGRVAAWAGAALFALHPIQSEAVAYLSARSWILASLFGFWSLRLADDAWLRWRAGAPWTGRALASAGATLLSVGSHPLGLAFPFVALGWLSGVRSLPPRARALAWVSAAAPVLALAPVLGQFLAHREAVRPPGYAAAYWAAQPAGVLLGLGKALLPVGLRVDYDLEPPGVSFAPSPVRWPKDVPGVGPGSAPRFGAAGFTETFRLGQALRDIRFWLPAALLAAGALALWRLRSRAALLGAAGWLLLWAPSAAAPLEDLFFEHRLYASMAGLAWLSGGLAAWLSGEPRLRPRLLAAAAAAVFLFGVGASERMRVWSHPARLWAEAVRLSPGKPRPRFNLATSLYRAGVVQPERLLRLCVTASAVRSDFRDNRVLAGEIPNLMGGIYDAAGERQQAHFFYRTAVANVPSAELLWNLGSHALELSRFDEAAACFSQLSELSPRDARYRFYLALSLEGLSRPDEAARMLEDLLEGDPGNASVAAALARVLTGAGRHAEAAGACRAALARTKTAPLYYNLAVAEKALGRTAEARAALLAAIRMDPGLVRPDDALCRDLLGK